jgi:hypothetical protein
VQTFPHSFRTALLGIGITLVACSRPPSPSPLAVAVPPAASQSARFILNALLAPTLDSDALPLRWIDPRPASLCGPATTVRVNRAPLVVGALVPDTPFELDWHSDGCRPFGANGPRFDGSVRLTVFREDWGFSAIVEPVRLRVASAADVVTLTQRSAATLPQSVDPAEPVEVAVVGTP